MEGIFIRRAYPTRLIDIVGFKLEARITMPFSPQDQQQITVAIYAPYPAYFLAVPRERVMIPPSLVETPGELQWTLPCRKSSKPMLSKVWTK